MENNPSIPSTDGLQSSVNANLCLTMEHKRHLMSIVGTREDVGYSTSRRLNALVNYSPHFHNHTFSTAQLGEKWIVQKIETRFHAFRNVTYFCQSFNIRLSPITRDVHTSDVSTLHIFVHIAPSSLSKSPKMHPVKNAQCTHNKHPMCTHAERECAHYERAICTFCHWPYLG